MRMNKEIFKAYDIRGVYPTDINADDVYRIAKAYASWLKPKKVALGRDVRLSGEELWNAAAKGLMEMGVDVVDIGVVSTDMLYFSVANYGFDGGITISASHNAGEYNGMKLVREESRPISIDTGIAEIRDLALNDEFVNSAEIGKVEKLDILDDYIAKMLSFVDISTIKPCEVVVNPNFGASGRAIDKIADALGTELVRINFEPDGHFPKGKPDPTQVANREETTKLIVESGARFGSTWDADADRCFFFDEKSNFILPYYITGLMMEYFLKKSPDSTFVIDPRLVWLPEKIAADRGARIAINKSGHSFIKDRMRSEDAIFGAETSAHYYFRDLWYTDNGMLPFIIMLQILSQDSRPLSEIIADFQSNFFAIEETNFQVNSVPETIERVSTHYSGGKRSEIDGISVEYPDFRFNLRGSNTEPVIRLNIEATSAELARQKLVEIGGLING